MLTDLSFAGKRVVILGLARQGLALVRFFLRAGAIVTVNDRATSDQLASELAQLDRLPVTLALGGHPVAVLEACDLLCLSGGVPPQIPLVQEAIARGLPLSNDSLLTLQLIKQRGLGPVAAITGSSGKTTTTTLVGQMLERSGFAVHVGGNIGTPLLNRIDSIEPGERIVMELSSFQLELFDPAISAGNFDDLGPDAAAILNVTPNHLDRHTDMAAYANAKMNLLKHMRAGGTVVLGADDPVTAALLAQDPSADEKAGVPESWRLDTILAETRWSVKNADMRVVPFGCRHPLVEGAWLADQTLIYRGQPICDRGEIRLRGDHNIYNLLAAMAVSGALGASPEAMGDVARTFAGVSHRLEVVAEMNGILWINDSIATSPERAIAGLRTFDPAEGEVILLAGGKDKNLPWERFADEVLARVSYLIGFGQAGASIVEQVQARAQFRRTKLPSSAVVQRLEEAVALAARVAAPGTVVLLSPGCTSYDAYQDFEARGEHFRRLVNQVDLHRV